ncbi:O-antigen ligase family protein [uncultured Nocardioides sp.]|uniref:O-antigen ligase family protein n=1 Tax=uncultured Nocardioides sp. TaxID=198441 RepID=UPI00261522F4|nr:O-antigen ligase family protein [uncultured Nocardioides sp.]
MTVTDLVRQHPGRRVAPREERRADGRAAVARAARPLAVLLLGYPLWWVLGIQIPLWPVAALPLLAWLVTNRRQVVLPPGYGVLLVFLGWVLISALMLTSARYALAYGLRTTLYVAVAIMAFFVWNALHRGLDRRRVLGWLLALWGAAVLLALPGLLVAPLEIPTPFGTALRTVGINNPYVVAMTRARFTEFDQLYQTARPAALFPYTNDWAAAMGILTPVAVHGALTAATRRRRVLIAVLLAVSAVPILISVNRGAWVSITVAVVYVMVVRVAAGRPKVLLGVLGGAGVVATVVATVPGLLDTLTSRFEYSNVSTRETLYQASWELALRSPFFGYGAPQSSEGLADSNDVSIGTHGQLWTTMVSHGLVGAALLLGTIAAIWWHSRPARAASPDLWLHATGVVVVVQTAFYDILPVPLATALFALAVCATGRRGEGTDRSADPRTTPEPAGGPYLDRRRPERKHS